MLYTVQACSYTLITHRDNTDTYRVRFIQLSLVCFIPKQQGLCIIILEAMEKVVDDVSKITHHFPRKQVLATQSYPYAKLMDRLHSRYTPYSSLRKISFSFLISYSTKRKSLEVHNQNCKQLFASCSAVVS